MTDHIISTDRTTGLTLGTDDTYVLLPGVAHTAPNGGTVSITNSDAFQIGVFGFLYNANLAAILAYGGGPEDNQLTIGASGTVTSLSGTAYTISLDSDDTNINNAGEIIGVAALGLFGDTYRLTNTGLITSGSLLGSTYTVTASSATNVEINNSGEIIGRNAINARSDVVIVNSGIIQGSNEGIAIGLGNQADVATIINTGTLSGGTGDAIDSVSHAVALDNLGDIAGDVQLSNQVDVVNNTGVIAGDVDMGAADDVITNSGQITGDLDLGISNDIYVGVGDGTVGGTIFGGFGNDTIYGGAQADVINGNQNNDLIRGRTGDDILDGAEGNDTLRAGGGDDEVSGGAGDDLIRGGAGEDVINGGVGSDTLFGGTESDTFVFTAEADSPDNNTLRDIIQDFEAGVDFIDLTAFGGLDFVGNAGFSGTGAEVYVTDANSIGRVKIFVDVDGDGTADMKIILNNTATLTEDAFLL